MTGELNRSFWKHKIYADLFVVEIADGRVVAAARISSSAACAHRLDEYELSLEEGEKVQENKRDFEPIDMPCTDAGHWLSDIAAAEKECQLAEEQWKSAHATAKAAKEVFDMKQASLRSVVRKSTDATPMPLFEQAAGA